MRYDKISIYVSYHITILEGLGCMILLELRY
jgi:hypothetical protein